MRAVGSEADVKEYFDWLDAQAAACHVSWKAVDSYVGTKYVFLGTIFDHAAKQVSVGPKAAKKLQHLPTDATVGDVEAMVGRLMHASAILALNPARWYWLLKMVRRKLSQLNRGLCDRRSAANLPPIALHDLREWTELAKNNVPRQMFPKKKTSGRMVLFTDSSADGWGAVLIDTRTAAAQVAGGRWMHTARHNISPAEVRAVTLGIQAFATQLQQKLRGGKLLVLVDNTSAVASITKGRSTSEAMNAEVRRMTDLLHIVDLEVSVQWVPTAYNLADGPSRAKAIDWQAWGQAG